MKKKKYIILNKIKYILNNIKYFSKKKLKKKKKFK
jgi:hypothetical protein